MLPASSTHGTLHVKGCVRHTWCSGSSSNNKATKHNYAIVQFLMRRSDAAVKQEFYTGGQNRG
jgi:hypothetical protein